MPRYSYSHNRFLKLRCEPVIHFKEDTMLEYQYMSSEITAGFANAIFMRISWRQSHLIPENKNLKWILLNYNYPLVRKFRKFYCLYNWNDLLSCQHRMGLFWKYLWFLNGIMNIGPKYSWFNILWLIWIFNICIFRKQMTV